MLDFEDLDYYELLGVSRSASPEEIRRAFRQEMSKYHPDRFVNASPDEQEYASRRSQRITEAYSVLNDFAARSAYNRGQQPTAGTTPRRRTPTPPPPAQPRDHQAELYEQAQTHLAAGRTMQAISALRQLQQLNPFYRDSAALLANAEAQLHARQEQRPRRGLSRPLLVVSGFACGLTLAVLISWRTGLWSTPSATGNPGAATPQPVAVVETEPPTQPPEPSMTLTSPTLEPTPPPTATVPAPTEPPTPTEPPAPTATPRPTVVVAEEEGRVLLADAFTGAGWAALNGNGWSVGYDQERYRISVNRGGGLIWSYRSLPAAAVSVGVDVQVVSGEGGILLRFIDANNYLSFSVNPSETSYRLEHHKGGAIDVLAGGQSEAIQHGSDARNRLVARMRGNKIQLLANQQVLAEVDAPEMPETLRYGLLAIGGHSAAEAYFDNLEIRALN